MPEVSASAESVIPPIVVTEVIDGPARSPRWMWPVIGGVSALALILGISLLVADRGDEPDVATATTEPEPRPRRQFAQPAPPPDLRPARFGDLTFDDIAEIREGSAIHAMAVVIDYLGPENIGDFSDEQWDYAGSTETVVRMTVTGRIEYLAQNRASPSRYRCTVTVDHDLTDGSYTVVSAKVGSKQIIP